MPSLREEYLEAYGEHARTLRLWLVAYGIGAPVLLVTNDVLFLAVLQSGVARQIAFYFLAGVGLQVVISTASKNSMWALYYGETAPRFKQTRRFKVAYWFSEQYWIDLLFDLVTLAFFLVATAKSLSIVLKAI